jgi:Fic family protein
MKYKLNDLIINQIIKFTKLYERLGLLDFQSKWMRNLKDYTIYKKAFCAVIFDKSQLGILEVGMTKKDFLENLGLTTQKKFKKYLSVLESIPESELFRNKLSEKILLNIINKLIDNEHIEYRSDNRVISKVILEKGVYKTIDTHVITRPKDISINIDNLNQWFQNNSKQKAFFIKSAIAHHKIAAIHPFNDGNGRLARIIENSVLFNSSIDRFFLLALEEFYLYKIEVYYRLFEETINSRDYTRWLEFYSEGLLYAIDKTFNDIYDISGGTIDLYNKKVIDLTDKELEVVNILRDKGQSSGAEVAKKLDVSRQNINVIMKRLYEKDVVKKIGEGTSTRYKLIF